MFHYLQSDSVLLSGLGGILSGVILVDIGHFHAVISDSLHLFSQPLHLCAVLFIGWGHIQGEQMAQRILCRMYLRSFAAFGSVHSHFD
jgi:hypothetical protein